MNGIGLAATVYDLIGAEYIRGETLDIGASLKRNNIYERRASRVMTLDGGSAISDTGYSASDRTLFVSVRNAPEAIAEFFRYLVQTYEEITITSGAEAFIGMPQRSYLDEDGSAILEVWITEDIGG